MRRDAGLETRGAAAVIAFHNLGDSVQARDDGGRFVGDAQVHEFAHRPEHRAELGHQLAGALAGARGNPDRVGESFLESSEEFAAIEAIHLVEDHQRGLAAGTDFLEHAVDGKNLLFGLGMAEIHDVQEQFRLHDFFQRGLEGFDEAMGELADEADGVGVKDVLVGGQTEAARGGIERGEHHVLRERGRAGEAVEQGGFAGVGIADDRGERPEIALSPGALGQAVLADFFELAADSGNAILDAAAIGFELRLAVTAHADAAFLARQMSPEPGEPREQVLELGEFNLELAFAGARALGKDVEDERGAIEYLALEDFLEIAALRRGKLVVKDDGIDVVLSALAGEFAGLAGADEGAGHRGIEFLGAVADHFAARAGGEFLEFGEGILEIQGGAGFEFHPDEEDSLGALAGCFDQRFQTSVQGRRLAQGDAAKNKILRDQTASPRIGDDRTVGELPYGLAEGVGFEPTVRLPARLISSQVPSTTQPPFHLADFIGD